MSFIKLGEAIEISKVENTDACVASVDADILENFKKFAANLKRVAPRAEDFLYFIATFMHAAEASAINDDGSPKLTLRGEPLQVGWNQKNGTWKWETNDSSVLPYRNSNGDIFPESELIKAHKKWAGKPLCIDHKSSSVDHVRGFIVDTYYDRNLKRVVGLCALDKVGYPQLARQVATGVSTAVSMGTAVGKAICSDCGNVAKTADDFCDHMRRKTCYGEINIDLNPIELSIVVNGADPKAHIKHVIAAAQNLNNYLDSKSQELKKMADLNFTATLSVSDPKGNEGGGSSQINIEANNFDQFKEDLDKAFDKLKEINEMAKNSQKDTNDSAFNQSSGTVAMDETVTPNTDNSLAPPAVRFAKQDESIAELRTITTSIESKLNEMKQNFDKLANTSTKEETMSGSKEMNKKEAYFQGGGGVNEPTPGQPKYEKDPKNEDLRANEDKQMVGQSPFPGVGPVDGMHPSPESVDPSNELERKKMLARAEAEERAMKRTAIVAAAKKALENKKEAYFQGGGGVNEPTPGEKKYPADKLNEKDREEEDKQMVGQKPFPGVGSVDGLHPSPASADVSDELKRKEMLGRASLRARFVKSANNDGSHNLGKSSWEVFLGDKLLLTASVNDLSGGRSEVMYDTIATKEFGAKLIEKVKVQGADKVMSLIKSAQMPPAPAAEPAPEMAPAPEAAETPVSDSGKDGDAKDTVLELAEKVKTLSSDLDEGVKALLGEQAEMGEMTAPEMGAMASGELKTLNSMHKELNTSLLGAMKESVANLNDHKEELDMIAGMYDKGVVTSANEEFVNTLVEGAVDEAKVAVADGLKLMEAFVKYAKGTQALTKRSEMEKELKKLAHDGDTMTDSTDKDLMDLINDTNSDLDAVKEMMADTGETPAADDTSSSSSPADDNALMAKPGELKDLEVKPGTNIEVTANLNTKEGRAALRTKLAADALGKEDSGEVQDMSKAKFSDMLEQANDLANGQTKLDTKPSDELGKVETLPEANKKIMDVALAPPKVRKEAEAIQKLIAEGKLDKSDLDELVAQGLDKDAVAYWKKYYGQVEGGGEFASELVKEHVKAQMEEQFSQYRVKIARAYELTYDMVDRGLCHNDRTAISSQVDEIMKFNDEGFDSLKKVVARHAPAMRKEAGRMPLVGVTEDDNGSSSAPTDMYSQLSAAFSKSNRRMF